VTLWQVDIYPAAGRPDLAGRRAAAGAADLGLGDHLTIHAAYGYLLQGELTREQVELLARELLSDPIVERTIVGRAGEAALAQVPPEAGASACAVHVLPKPGVMDPVAISTRQAIADFHLQADEVRTFRKYWIEGPATKPNWLAWPMPASWCCATSIPAARKTCPSPTIPTARKPTSRGSATKPAACSA